MSALEALCDYALYSLNLHLHYITLHFNQVFIDKRSGSGVHVFQLAFEHTEDILNTEFRYV